MRTTNIWPQGGRSLVLSPGPLVFMFVCYLERGPSAGRAEAKPDKPAGRGWPFVPGGIPFRQNKYKKRMIPGRPGYFRRIIILPKDSQAPPRYLHQCTSHQRNAHLAGGRHRSGPCLVPYHTRMGMLRVNFFTWLLSRIQRKGGKHKGRS